MQAPKFSKPLEVFPMPVGEGIPCLFLTAEDVDRVIIIDRSFLTKMITIFPENALAAKAENGRTSVEESKPTDVPEKSEQTESFQALWDAKTAENQNLPASKTGWTRVEDDILVEEILVRYPNGHIKRGNTRRLWLYLASGIIDRTPDAIASRNTKLHQTGDFDRIKKKIEQEKSSLKS